MTFVSRPKTLAERLAWMAENLPGVREELEAVETIRKTAIARRTELPARSVSEDSQLGPAGDAPLGIYGENAVTLPKRGDHE